MGDTRSTDECSQAWQRWWRRQYLDVHAPSAAALPVCCTSYAFLFVAAAASRRFFTRVSRSFHIWFSTPTSSPVMRFPSDPMAVVVVAMAVVRSTMAPNSPKKLRCGAAAMRHTKTGLSSACLDARCRMTHVRTRGVVVTSARSTEALTEALDPSFEATVAATLEEISTEVPEAHHATVAWARASTPGSAAPVAPAASGADSAAATVAPAVPWESCHECVTPGGYRHLVKRRASEDGGYEFLFRGVAPVSALHWFAATSDLEYMDSWNKFTVGVEVFEKGGDVWKGEDRGEEWVSSLADFARVLQSTRYKSALLSILITSKPSRRTTRRTLSTGGTRWARGCCVRETTFTRVGGGASGFRRATGSSSSISTPTHRARTGRRPRVLFA